MNNVNDFQPVHLSGLVEESDAGELYMLLKNETSWGDGIRTRFGTFTRKAVALHSYYDPIISRDAAKLLRKVLEDIKTKIKLDYFLELGCYINYYEDGNHYTPQHRHPGQVQLVISLGNTRILEIEGKKYPTKNGDVVLFGSQKHGVPRDTKVKHGRISIAVFMDASANISLDPKYVKENEHKDNKQSKKQPEKTMNYGPRNRIILLGKLYFLSSEQMKEVPKLVNIRGTKNDPQHTLYIGRKLTMGGWNLCESKWHNPFPAKGNVSKSVNLFEQYLLDNKELLKQLPELTGEILGCWCVPNSCHGEVIIKLYLERVLKIRGI